jgi:hypothetical protein
MDLSVLHIGSWGGDPGRPEVERINDVDFIDVRHFCTNRLHRVLDELKPDAVLFLSTDTFAHRTFNRYCQARGIPTLHLYHGLVSVQDTGHARMYKINPWAQLRFVAVRIPKALRFIWPAYARSLLVTGAAFGEWLRFIRDIGRQALGRYAANSALDSRTTVGCVYVDADVEHAMGKYGFARDRVFAVGNPDLARFGLDQQCLGYHAARPQRDLRDVLYIDTGLIFTGFVFDSPLEFVEHLVQTQRELARHGKRLLFKPHPDHLRTDTPRMLAAAGIEICGNEQLVARLRDCCACIVEPSSASLVPALMATPLLLARYGKLTGQRFGSVLTTYPRAAPLDDLADFSRQLRDIESRSVDEQLLAWLHANAGPLPAEDMPRRVAAVIEDLVRTRRAPGTVPTSLATPC